ncbi:hypothetical protein [Pedobacter sp. SYP-B3415]|uniref:hypothetical protein n=1 Tax=Pedobacter sp. SYP-B3415 TaxID=2496641 RepID=UPI00101DB5E3|nr:hypothetical protein [Pedobacter sp. SYP-B3415]
MARQTLIIVAASVYFLAAIFNTGFYHPDEHFQLIEFAEYLSGHTSSIDLAWEFDAAIRPALQPVVIKLLFDCCRWLSISDPYVLALMLRVVSAGSAVAVLTYYVARTEHLVPPNQLIYYRIFSYFLWFLPFVNVRFSSESASGMLLTLAVAFCFSSHKLKFAFIGLCLGLAFSVRYQSAIIAIGLLIWLIAQKRIDKSGFAYLASGGLFVIIFTLFIDWFFYGQIVLPYLNYFTTNVIENVASSFGTSPWSYYFVESYKSLTPIVSVPIFVALGFLLLRPQHVQFWIILPFLVIHMITPHKELRFLFPLVNFIPLLLMTQLNDIATRISSLSKITINILPCLTVLIIVNVSIMVGSIFFPADGIGRNNITNYIHTKFGSEKVNLWIKGNKNPYEPIAVKQNFYLDQNVQFHLLDTVKKIHLNSNCKNFVVGFENGIKQFQGENPEYKVKEVISGVPNGLLMSRRFLGLSSSTMVLCEISKVIGHE